MSSKYPLLPPRRVIAVLNKFGFIKVGQKGSHVKFKSIYTNKVCILPNHDEVARGTLRNVLEQADITLEDFLNQL